jgi:anti-anti-sigma regulatory factor
MATSVEFLKVDGDRVAECIHEAHMQLDTARDQTTLDFSSVLRITPQDLRAMEELADRADNQSVKVVLCEVNVDIYKVLKLVKLAPRFSFTSDHARSIEAHTEESSHAEATD